MNREIDVSPNQSGPESPIGHQRAENAVATLTKQFEYLDQLRKSGATNMFGSSPYLERRFGLSPKRALSVLGLWMDTFSDEPAADRASKASEISDDR